MVHSLPKPHVQHRKEFVFLENPSVVHETRVDNSHHAYIQQDFLECVDSENCGVEILSKNFELQLQDIDKDLSRFDSTTST